MKSLNDIKTIVTKLAKKIDASADMLPTYGQADNDARPHIEVAKSYHYVIVERDPVPVLLGTGNPVPVLSGK